MKFVNIAAYKFVTLSQQSIQAWRTVFRAKAVALGLKGTILLSTEGINLFMSGTPDHIEQFKLFLDEYPALVGLTYKASLSDGQPFKRMLVRLKKEIISMGYDDIQPEKQTAPYLAPEELKRWYEEGKEMIVLDTRNDYEIELGTFEKAVNLDIKSFRDFPERVKELPESMKNKPVVTFCTGGVRCEKAAEWMHRLGFKEVYQLEGGILNYFEQCGGEHYEGECFVFDKRVAVDTQLQETTTKQCFDCRNPVTAQHQTCGKCSYCGGERFG